MINWILSQIHSCLCRSGVPLTQLTHKPVPLIWTEQSQKPFKMLKDALMKNPILVYPDTKKTIYFVYR